MKVWTAFLVCGVMVSAVAWIVALLRENGVCPFGAAARFVRGLPWGGRLALLPLFTALVVYGSVKNSGGIDEGASHLDLDGGTCKTRETCRTNGCLNLAGGLGLAGVNLNLAGGAGEESGNAKFCELFEFIVLRVSRVPHVL